jgi:hypothetical protein
MGFLSLIAQLGININPYVQGLFKARHHAQEFGRDVVGDLKRELAGFFTVGAIYEWGKKTIEFGSQMNDLAERLGTTTTKMQEWNYAAEQNGATSEHVTKFFEDLSVAQTKALDGNEDTIEAFKRLGVSIRNLQTMRTDEIGRKIAETVRHGDVQKLAADLREVGGKGARALITAFKEGIDEAGSDAHRLGLIIEENVIKSLDEAGDAVDRLKRKMVTLSAPIVSGISKDINSTLSLISAYFQHFKGAKGFDQDFITFLNSREAQKIVADVENPPSEKQKLPKEIRKFTPPKQPFDNNLLGEKIGRIASDSLAAVGGFVGNSANAANVVDIARQQLLVQKTIAKNTEPKNQSADKFSYQ